MPKPGGNKMLKPRAKSAEKCRILRYSLPDVDFQLQVLRNPKRRKVSHKERKDNCFMKTHTLLHPIDFMNQCLPKGTLIHNLPKGTLTHMSPEGDADS